MTRQCFNKSPSSARRQPRPVRELSLSRWIFGTTYQGADCDAIVNQTHGPQTDISGSSNLRIEKEISRNGAQSPGFRHSLCGGVVGTRRTIESGLGEEFWANPMEDWRVADGAAECQTTGGNRNIHLLTHQLTRAGGSFEMTVRVKQIEVKRTDGGAGSGSESAATSTNTAATALPEEASMPV